MVFSISLLERLLTFDLKQPRKRQRVCLQKYYEKERMPVGLVWMARTKMLDGLEWGGREEELEGVFLV